MPTEVEIAVTDEGRLTLKGNELLLYDTTAGDPVAIRFRSNNETRGKHSIDKFVDGAWRELGFIVYKEDERGRNQPQHANTLEIVVWAHKPQQAWNDADYEPVFAIRHDGLVAYQGGGDSNTDNKLVSADGRFVTVLQAADGHMVQYDMSRGPEGDPNAAVWSSWHGILKPLPW